MKRLNLRLDDFTYEMLKQISQKNNQTMNSYIEKIIIKNFKNDTDLLSKFSEQISLLTKKIESISKKQKLHYDLSVQHFVNQGYYENANFKNDKCYQELLNNYKDKFNE